MCCGSIGSLGENGGYDTVEQVRVENCNITRTTNGLRIKTVPVIPSFIFYLNFLNDIFYTFSNLLELMRYFLSRKTDERTKQTKKKP